MKLVILFGPPAVGKMTAARELAKITGLKLFHNHMSLELVNQFFDFGTPAFERLDRAIRFAIFEEVAKSELPGLIFTMVWALNHPEDEQ
jgi:stage III sporulation protein SpoIIIAA